MRLGPIQLAAHRESRTTGQLIRVEDASDDGIVLDYYWADSAHFQVQFTRVRLGPVPSTQRFVLAHLQLRDLTFAPYDRPYDPYVPSPSGSQPGSAGRQPGSATGSGSGGQGNSRTAAIQAEIDNTVNIMQQNIKKVAERGERLDSLQDKTGGRGAMVRPSGTWT
jgi:hypothetical protein